MRIWGLVASLPILSASLFASEIREFDLKTIERLGSDLAQVSQQPDKGATTPVRERACETAIAALRGKLFNIHYAYVVLDDPDGSGFLVYALAQSNDRIVLGGHFRVTISADGRKVERLDALSRTLVLSPAPPKGSKRQKPLVVSMSQIVSNKPLETCVYTSLHDKVIVSVGMVKDNAKVWAFVGDKAFEMTPDLTKQLGIEDNWKR